MTNVYYIKVKGENETIFSRIKASDSVEATNKAKELGEVIEVKFLYAV